MLPQRGLREVTDFRIHENRFVGALEDGGMRAIVGLQTLKVMAINGNFFAGTVAESLPCSWRVSTQPGIVSKFLETTKSLKVSFSSPQDIASSAQSHKAGRLVGA
eukprot:2933493-Amphidinium_carterae.1